MDLFISFAVIFFCHTSEPILAITTTHHDKPLRSSVTSMATMMREKPEIANATLTPAEREKRLLPYETFYHNRPPPGRPRFHRLFERPDKYDDYALYHPRSKFTPFLDSNALPGAFRPMANPPPDGGGGGKLRYVSVPQNKVADFGAIYENLAQLKLQQNDRRPPPSYERPQLDYGIRPTKTIIETFTATSIDIPGDTHGIDHFRPVDAYRETEPLVHQQIVLDVPHRASYPIEDYVTRKPYFVIVPATDSQATLKPLLVIQRKPFFKAKHGYEAPKYVRISEEAPAAKHKAPLGYEEPTVGPKYEDSQRIQAPQYEEPISYQVTARYEELRTMPPPPQYRDDPVSLSKILKHLQATNTLPKTLTPDNIDRSIKTLVRILDALKRRQQIAKPAAVQEADYVEDVADNEAGVGISGRPGELPGTQQFPPDTDEGGTPGKAGVDYPALSTIPQTSFDCKTQRYKGFFGDPDTNCQVWHYCDLNGGQASFLCPNGTIFSQVALTCDWWYNVKCATTSQLYVLNERLYKYIIPLSPKFPEDYSGPLVDKYLALKFQEMEEKMRKEKKGKGNPIKPDESTKTEDGSSDTTSEFSTVSSQKETLQTIEDHNSNK